MPFEDDSSRSRPGRAGSLRCAWLCERAAMRPEEGETNPFADPLATVVHG